MKWRDCLALPLWIVRATLIVSIMAACGGSEKLLRTTDVVATLRDAGFYALHVISNQEQATNLARDTGQPELARHPVDFDFIYAGRLGRVFDAHFTATRFPTIALARQRIKSDRPLLTGELVPSATFDRRHLTEVRICNVVLTSYNPENDVLLRSNLTRAAAELRELC